MSTLALIVAGGHGSRFGTALPKQYQPLGGVALIRHTLRAFLCHPQVDAVRVVIAADAVDVYRAETAGLALLAPAFGGASRQQSVLNGLESMTDDPPRSVLIHDAARPFVSAELILRVLAALETWPGAIPAIAVQDTLKRAAAAGAPPRITETVDRSGLWRAQTPQGFRFSEILAAHRTFAGTDCTDDAQVAERYGLEVAMVPGDEDNFKVTTPDDLDRAARILAAEGETRTGFGFDVHRFGPGDHVMLAGVAVPHAAGLLGHSDADVALHALTDALLGAIAGGDIGQHFPPSDPRWKGQASDVFLRDAAERVRAAGGVIVNVDVTIVAEQPRIGPHRAAMAARVADILGIEPPRVGIKATTTERLGFTGRGEGIAAQAVATVRLPRRA
jgi:2-C-methyl-D-erythritol 4-phosphate cytidylyltransferase / 2-C-methyl-D-erythritol 2,4-cyclodiphosphate synthase